MKQDMNQTKESNDKKLKEMAYEAIEWRYPDMKEWTPCHDERLKNELSIISKHGYSEAFCIIANMINN